MRFSFLPLFLVRSLCAHFRMLACTFFFRWLLFSSACLEWCIKYKTFFCCLKRTESMTKFNRYVYISLHSHNYGFNSKNTNDNDYDFVPFCIFARLVDSLKCFQHFFSFLLPFTSRSYTNKHIVNLSRQKCHYYKVSNSVCCSLLLFTKREVERHLRHRITTRKKLSIKKTYVHIFKTVYRVHG